MIIAGIDPGKNGAIVILENDAVIAKHVSPKIGKKIDVHSYVEILRQRIDLVVIEDVHAIYGCSAGSTFAFGQASMLPIAAATALRIPIMLVPPKTWQKEMHVGIPLMYKPKKATQKNPSKDTKAMSLMAFKRLLPEIDARATARSTNPHDGIVDAALIALYGRRIRNGR